MRTVVKGTGPGWCRRMLVGVVAAGAVLAVATPATALPPVRERQWYLDALKIPQAQRISTGKGVTVAVIDSPVDATSPDLAGQVLRGTGSGDAGQASDDSAIHGTQVAGVIAAKGGGADHALGIAPGARILPVALPADRDDDDIANAIRWAADHGAQVINISVGGAHETPPQSEVDAVRYAMSKDAVIVAAAGNTAEHMSAVASPADIPGVIAVSGTDQSSDFWSGSVSGPEVVLAAPAASITTTYITGNGGAPYGHADGTSMAAPIVSGAAALVRSKFPHMNAANVVNRLLKTAKDQGDPGRDKYFGFGTVRPYDALTAEVPQVSANPLARTTGGGSSARTSAAGGHRLARPGGITVRGWVALGVGALILVVLIVVVLVLVVRRGKRRRPGSPPYQGMPPPYGSGPGGGPPTAPGPYGGPSAPAGRSPGGAAGPSPTGQRPTFGMPPGPATPPASGTPTAPGTQPSPATPNGPGMPPGPATQPGTAVQPGPGTQPGAGTAPGGMPGDHGWRTDPGRRDPQP
ncbi:MAG TPA: S8 family serine peptidase [Actinocatenispora sp.]